MLRWTYARARGPTNSLTEEAVPHRAPLAAAPRQPAQVLPHKHPALLPGVIVVFVDVVVVVVLFVTMAVDSGARNCVINVLDS